MDKSDQIPIEDFFEDILGKAMRGLGLSVAEAANRSGLPEQQIERLLDGQFDEDAVSALAGTLHLHGPSLVESGRQAWRPRELNLEGLELFNSSYHDMTVNAYLVWDPASRDAAVFDTGTDASVILRAVAERELKVGAVFLTHTHRDHIVDLHRVVSGLPGVPVYVGRDEPVDGAKPVSEGDTFSVGELTIEARGTSGHSIGGITYVVSGLAQPVAVVGDALFAGSMGGGMVSWSQALENNRAKLFTLPDDTVVCPGHGPMTTIGEEKAHNPCYPEFK